MSVLAWAKRPENAVGLGILVVSTIILIWSLAQL